MKIISAKIKDNILEYLCLHATPEVYSSSNTKPILEDIIIDFDTFNAVMIQFQRLGLISKLNLTYTHLSFILLTESHDFLQKGGFIIQDEIFKTNLDKLTLEIENLRKQLSPDKLDTVNKIASITSALFAGLALLPK